MATHDQRDAATRRPHYGTDAPLVPAIYLLLALAFLVGAVLSSPWLAIGAVVAAACAGLYLHATWRGKFVVWERLLDGLALRGDEQALDVGCGRGAVTIAVARRLPRGHVTGIDLWRRRDQSGNDRDATATNLAAAGVADRVTLETGDMRELPFPDDTFDLVVSSLAVHNLPHAADRDRAVDEIRRVLRPTGTLLLVDIQHTARYQQRLEGPRVARTGLGWRMWWTGPWMWPHVVTRAGS